MKLTERDLQIIRFCARHNLATLRHLSRVHGVTPGWMTTIVRRLVDAGYLEGFAPFYRSEKVFLATPLGVDVSESEVGRSRYVLAEVRHQIRVVDVYLDAMDRFPGATWTTERELRHRIMADEAQRTGQRVVTPPSEHLPDGVLQLPDGKRVAIEVELTSKRPYRRREILVRLLAKYDEVWYFLDPENRRLQQMFLSEFGREPRVRIYDFNWRLLNDTPSGPTKASDAQQAAREDLIRRLKGGTAHGQKPPTE